MSGGYHTWSKFNAHRWSNLNARRQTYWDERQKAAFAKLCDDEKIDPGQLEKILGTYAFANRLPREQEIVSSLTYKPKILERKPVLVRIAEKIREFIDTFIEGMGGV